MSGEVVLAASTDDQGIFATDLHTGAIVTTFEESAIQSHTFGTIGQSSSHIYAVQAKKALWHVWGWGDKKPCYRASLPEKMSSMAFTSDAALCFGGSVSGSIYVWQMGTGCLLRCWPAHFREVTQLLVSQDDCFLISASADASVQVFNLADIFCDNTPKPFHSWSGHSLAVTSVAQLPGSGVQQTIASASLDRSVRLWDVGTGKAISARTLSEPVNRIASGPSGTELLCACGNGELRSLGLTSAPGQSDALYVGHAGAVLGCALSADGSRIASCSEADRVRVWDTKTRQCVAQVLTSRNVQISSVQIVQRGAHSARPPPFQPFQRVMTAPEDLPPVPISTIGRAAALQEALEPHVSSRDFIDRIIWGQAAGLEALARSSELEEELDKVKAERTKWANAAANLYDALAEKITPDQSQPDETTASLVQATAVADTATGAAAEQSIANASVDETVEEDADEDDDEEDAQAPKAATKRKKKRRRQAT
mmetsp:Transcript_72749/g.115131  ORF Transcript_72749/g.115131 Transcript_72749/m.115131 type:complete len:483 (-) Transcript_72749:43-1491(-)